ncbi:MAG: tRNA (adenosine(37)-N6)-threonylcarbamoyltransferase complex ATPase subunit type 1 TsaE, partial [Cellulomonadaceae bacterium]|nr:tRNA (adenosine(37)-N6)-threonylcarbamoyltransferase complex ATPase subunit type 1 TsaE [Cellulomonadaceae bacterium]
LDSSLDESVTVVEWGAGLAEQLTDDHLDINLDRGHGGGYDPDNPEAGQRTATLRGVGQRWEGVNLAAVVAGHADAVG